MSPSTRKALAAIIALFLIFAVFRLVVSVVLLLRGENPGDYISGPAVSMGGMLLLGVLAWYFKAEYPELLSRGRRGE